MCEYSDLIEVFRCVRLVAKRSGSARTWAAIFRAGPTDGQWTADDDLAAVRMVQRSAHSYLPGGDPQTPRSGGGAGRSGAGPSWVAFFPYEFRAFVWSRRRREAFAETGPEHSDAGVWNDGGA